MRHALTLILLATLAAVLPRSLAADPPAAAPSAPATVDVLDAGSSWHYFIVRRTEEARFDDGVKTAALAWGGRTEHPKMRWSDPPPADWAKPDFDDSRWPRDHMPLHTNRQRTASLVVARARLAVDDPAKAGELTLRLAYSGGVVVYLNGVEVGRSHMPAGAVTPDTPADDYPKDAYLDPDGFLLRIGWGDPDTYKDRFALRTRHCEMKVPAARLVKGVNVLAVEIHRPITDGVLYTGKPRQFEKHYCPWETLSLDSATLTAAASLTAVQPKAFRVWNHLLAQRIEANFAGDPNEPLHPVRIYGARNGAFSGVVVAGGESAIADLKAAAGDLKSAGGTIAADRVELRFGLPDGVQDQKAPPWFDSLSPTPPAEVKRVGVAAVEPIWITVNVPADAKAGEYKGTVTVSADGADPVAVPVQLTVADWSLAPVTQSQTGWWLAQSPESLALAYDVPMWSDAHLKLIGQSFDLMRQVGARMIYVPLFAHAHFGNDYSMIRWVRQADGSYKPDFTVFEKYLATAVKHLGRLEVVCIHSWPVTSGGSYMGQAGKEREAKPYLFTAVDPKTGELTNVDGPTWGDADAMKALLKPAFDGIRERLAAAGVSADAMMIGICHDVMPSKECVAILKEASGSARWVIHCHPTRFDVHGEPAGYSTDVWNSPSAQWPDVKRAYGWQQKKHYLTFPRAGSNTDNPIDDNNPPAQYRVSCEAAICAGIRGYGWVAADFWPVLKDRRGRMSALLDRYPYDFRSNLGMYHAVWHLLGRGPDGPLPTTRHQMIRAGLQEAEARVFIEKALLDATARAALGDELADRCQKLLDRRLETIIWSKSLWDSLLSADWEGQGGALYAAAAEVAGKLPPAAH
ncbi:MAG: hypothetical protein BIFFINMI_01311 [Phycisphaerae bacterium]|nr:hypothetical protein [Phycisphaerae bacterium]